MKKILLAGLLALVASTPVLAQAPPSDASVKELLEVMQTSKLIDKMRSQVDAMVQAGMQQALQGKTITAEQQKILDDLHTQTRQTYDAEMDWAHMQPVMVAIYKKSFTQQDINGILAFYKSPAGRAVLTKMPDIQHDSLQAMRDHMDLVTPRLQKLEAETVEKLRATQPGAAATTPK
jgi:hypothetical protein